MARFTRSTIEADAPVDRSAPLFHPGGPTIDELEREGSTWYYPPAVVEKYIVLTTDPEKVWKPRQDYKTDNGMLNLHVQARDEARRRAGLSTTHDDRGREVDYRERDRLLGPPRDVVNRMEAFYVHWQIGAEAQRLVEQDEGRVKWQSDYVRSHTSKGSGKVHPRTAQVTVQYFSNAKRYQLSPGDRAGADLLFGLQALLGTHADGRPVWQHLLELLADDLAATDPDVSTEQLGAFLADLTARRR